MAPGRSCRSSPRPAIATPMAETTIKHTAMTRKIERAAMRETLTRVCKLGACELRDVGIGRRSGRYPYDRVCSGSLHGDHDRVLSAHAPVAAAAWSRGAAAIRAASAAQGLVA